MIYHEKKNEIIEIDEFSMLVFSIALLLKGQCLILFKVWSLMAQKNVNTHVQNLFKRGLNINKGTLALEKW